MQKEKKIMSIKRGNIEIIAIDEPPVNVLSKEVLEYLDHTLDRIEEDDSIRAVIVTGAGDKAFVAGGNIKEFPGWMDKGAALAKEKSLGLQGPLNKLEKLSKPTIAAINGHALGGGCELAMCCDLRIAEKQALIGLPEIKLGLFPGAGGTQRLPRLVGKTKAKELMLTGEPVSALEAMAIGLVNRVVEKGEALDQALVLAEKITSYSLPALSFMKKAIDQGYETTQEEGLAIEAEYFGHVFQTEDVKEGVDAFIHKRSPQFKHQ